MLCDGVRAEPYNPMLGRSLGRPSIFGLVDLHELRTSASRAAARRSNRTSGIKREIIGCMGVRPSGCSHFDSGVWKRQITCVTLPPSIMIARSWKNFAPLMGWE